MQKHDPGQAELSLSSPNKSPHSPKRAIPRTPAVMAGLTRCVQRCVMSCSIFSNSEMRRRCCGMRKDVSDARLSWSGLIWSPWKGDNAAGKCWRANMLRYPGFASSRRGGETRGRGLRVSTGCGGDADVSHPALGKKTSETVCVRARVHLRASEEAAARTCCKRLLITHRISLRHRCCNYMWRGTLKTLSAMPFLQ